ncbi:alpha/beta fold hydrolase [Staphylococcus delphini]|uniref:alpha/beta fold hydrolase n=2 Tax=Staphylococcus delphini TaxID=53344 RepID=UPI000BBC3F42|nr:alpha/beta hydrolase [Staphylococcus delphini]PCF37262.1 alpha/beta hydrolase [Staphylococcus delphini]PCF44947.1 alpha/beta hydrolase [Staphylococcus delphini]PCF48118.1 alpha/beta hydrolase [Staphylococcus delphini]PCF51107.1 alpha/beta hydrolase [Staphylococcus delphini]PCF58126.1 alpha/beta hydrolase [Staphylococcus delphini]
MSLANYETNIMKLSQSNDAELEVAIMGEQETDKAVVLLHGAIMNYKIMTIFAKYIHDVKLIFINCPGRGKSTSLERQDYDLSEYAKRINEALVNIVEASHISEMSMIGYSMGGLIATKLAGYNTLPIKHLIYLNSAAKIDYKELRFSKLLYEIMKDVKPGEQNEMINSIPEFVLSQGVSKKQKEGFNFSQYFAPMETMITDLMYTLRADYLADIDEIKEMPKVLFLLGEDDVIFPNKDSKITHEKFEALGADVQSIIYPDVGHLDFLRVLDDSSIAEQDSMTYHINQLLAE